MTATDPPVALPLNLHDYEIAARTVLPLMIFEFVAGGTGDEATVRGIRAAFDRWRLLPRMLQGVAAASTATKFLARKLICQC